MSHHLHLSYSGIYSKNVVKIQTKNVFYVKVCSQDVLSRGTLFYCGYMFTEEYRVLWRVNGDCVYMIVSIWLCVDSGVVYIV